MESTEEIDYCGVTDSVKSIPPRFPYHLMEISNINFKSNLDYVSLRKFLEDEFNSLSFDHMPNPESNFGYECTFIHNFNMITIDVTIFTANFYDGFIVEIRLLNGHLTTFDNGIKPLLKILNVTLDPPPPYVRTLPTLGPMSFILSPNPIEWEIDIINYFISLIDLKKSSSSMIQQGLTSIGQYISDPVKNYLFINDSFGIKLIKEIGVLFMSDYFQTTNIHIYSMLNFTEFINIKGSSDTIIRDVIMPCIPHFIKNISRSHSKSQHLNRVTLETILAISNRNVDYFKKYIDESEYITHLRSIIKCEIEARDVSTALYANQIIKII
jgi:hypothetical protein